MGNELVDPDFDPSSLELSAKHDVIQALILGQTPAQVALEKELALETVVWIMEHSSEFTGLTTVTRKSIALARADYLAAEMIRRSTGPEGIAATSTWINLQKREAALTGMDSPQKQEQHVKVELSWLSPQRLQYKEQGTLPPDITDVEPKKDPD